MACHFEVGEIPPAPFLARHATTFFVLLLTRQHQLFGGLFNSFMDETPLSPLHGSIPVLVGRYSLLGEVLVLSDVVVGTLALGVSNYTTQAERGAEM